MAGPKHDIRLGPGYLACRDLSGPLLMLCPGFSLILWSLPEEAGHGAGYGVPDVQWGHGYP